MENREYVTRNLALKLALPVAVVVFWLVVLEIGVRLFSPATENALLPVRNCLQRSNLLGVEFQRSCRGKVHKWKMRTNVHGLRGREVRDDGTIRILALGASTTYGFGVEEEESYPLRLERVLNAGASPPRYQVINAGVPGYTSYQGLMFLRERGLALEPAVVLVDFGSNDAIRDGDIAVAIDRQRRSRGASPLEDLLLAKSALYRFVRWVGAPSADDAGPRVAVPNFRKNIKAMVDLADTHDIGLVFLDIISDHYRAYGEALEEVGAETGTPIVHFNGPGFDDVHPNAKGLGKLARDIAVTLRQNQLVQ